MKEPKRKHPERIQPKSALSPSGSDSTDNQLLTPPEVAQRLRCSESFVYKQMAKGAIPSLRIGRKLFSSTKALDQWIDQNMSLLKGA